MEKCGDEVNGSPLTVEWMDGRLATLKGLNIANMPTEGSGTAMPLAWSSSRCIPNRACQSGIRADRPLDNQEVDIVPSKKSPCRSLERP